MADTPLTAAISPFAGGEGFVSPFAGMAPLPGSVKPAAAVVPASPEDKRVINVVSPDGQTFGLPVGSLPQALKQGYRPETPEETAVREYLDENPGLAGDAKAAWRSFVNQAAFGVPEIVEKKTGFDVGTLSKDPFSYAMHEGLAKRHSFASMMGGMGGFGLSMLFGGPLFKAAGKAGGAAERIILGGASKAAAAETAERALTYRLAEGAAELATTEAGKEAARAAAPGIAHKIVAGVAGGAAEGAVLSAPTVVTEAALGDKDAAAEALYWNIGAGALFGVLGPLGHEIMAARRKGIAPKAPGGVPEVVSPPPKEAGHVPGFFTPQEEAAIASWGSLPKAGAASETTSYLPELVPHGPPATALAKKNIQKLGGVEPLFGERPGILPPELGPEVLAEPISKPAIGGGPKDWLGTFASEQALHSFRPGAKVARKLNEMPGGAEYAGDVILKHGLEKRNLKSWAETAEEVAATRKMLAERELSPNYKKLSVLQDDSPLQVADMRELAERMRKGPLAELKAQAMFEPEVKRMEAAIDSIEAHATGPVTIEDLWQQRKIFDKKVYKERKALTPDAIPTEMRDMQREFLRYMDESLEKAARVTGYTDAYKTIKVASREYAVLAELEHAAIQNKGRDVGNRGVSLTDYLGTLVGQVFGSALAGPLGGVVAGILGAGVNKVLRENAAGSLARLAYNLSKTNGVTLAERAMAMSGAELPRATEALEALAKGKGGGGGERAPSPAAIFSRFLPPNEQSKDKWIAWERLRKRVDELRDNPAALEALLDGIVEPFKKDAPITADLLKAKYKQALGIMDKALPPTPTKPQMGGAVPKPPEKAINAAAAQLEMLHNPAVVIDKMKKKQVQKPHVDLLNAQYGKWTKALGDHIVDTSAKSDMRLPYDARLNVGLIAPTVKGAGAYSVPALQKVYNSQQPLGEGRGRPRAGGASGALKSSGGLETGVSRVTHK